MICELCRKNEACTDEEIYQTLLFPTRELADLDLCRDCLEIVHDCCTNRNIDIKDSMAQLRAIINDTYSSRWQRFGETLRQLWKACKDELGWGAGKQ